MDYESSDTKSFESEFENPPPKPEEALADARDTITKFIALSASGIIVIVVAATLVCFFGLRYM